jgi:hypothetical protein
MASQANALSTGDCPEDGLVSTRTTNVGKPSTSMLRLRMLYNTSSYSSVQPQRNRIDQRRKYGLEERQLRPSGTRESRSILRTNGITQIGRKETILKMRNSADPICQLGVPRQGFCIYRFTICDWIEWEHQYLQAADDLRTRTEAAWSHTSSK